MTYEEFVKEYERLVDILLWSYKPGQIGVDVYCSKLADLTDAYPKYEQIYEANLYPTGWQVKGLACTVAL